MDRIEIRKADLEDIQGIIRVCSDGYRATYPGLLPEAYIEKIIEDFYCEERIRNEILNTDSAWNGWFVAVEDGQVIGAGGGGFIGENAAELFVLYLNPCRKREGIGSRLLACITAEQIQLGAKEQWVSVARGNTVAIAFYKAVGFQYQGQRPAHGLPEEAEIFSLRYRRLLNTER